jgi:uncharacterized membrane protein YhaH (DUF805 family)
MGLLLIVVSGIHFAVTSGLVHALIDGHVDASQARIVRQSFLLNHLVVGVLLIPLALGTIFAAPGVAAGDPLSRRVGWSNTLTVLALPFVLVAVMGKTELLGGGPFTVAVAMVFGAAAAMVTGMLLPRSKRA